MVEFLKRTLDVVCASLLFLILSPVMLMQGNLDYLAIGNFLVEHPKARA